MRLSAVSLFAAALCGLAAHAAPKLQTIAADDSRFRYEGRFDTAKPEAPAVVWQASRIAIDFEGTALALRFDWGEGQNYFDVTVDGATAVLAVNDASHTRLVFPQPLAAGRHHLVVLDVTTVFAQVEGDAIGAGRLGLERRRGGVGLVRAARLAHRGHVINVDVQPHRARPLLAVVTFPPWYRPSPEE